MGGCGPLARFNTKADQDIDTTGNAHMLPAMKQMKSSLSLVTQSECPSRTLDTNQRGISSNAKIRLLLHLHSPDVILRASIQE